MGWVFVGIYGISALGCGALFIAGCYSSYISYEARLRIRQALGIRN